MLWFCGLWGIGRWWRNEVARRTKGSRPGQRDWALARDRVRTQMVELGGGDKQFRVDLLLKETTGLGVEDLSWRIKRFEQEALRRANGGEDALQACPVIPRVLWFPLVLLDSN